MAKSYETSKSLAEALKENEVEANLFLARLTIVLSGLLLVFFTFAISYYSNFIVLVHFWILAGLVVVGNVTVLVEKGKARRCKHIILASMFVLCTFAYFYAGYNGELVFLIPIVYSMRYYRPRLTRNTAIAAAAVMVCACFASGVFDTMNGNIDVASLDKKIDGFAFVVSGSVAETLFDQGYITFLDVMRLKMVGSVVYAIAIALVGYIAYIASAAGFRMIQRQIDLDREKNAIELEKERHQAAMTRLENQVSISQIQPHFLYNSLSTIAALCSIDPEAARDALNQFSDYMRVNMNSMRESRLVPFSEELEHTNTYIMLEKLRFGDDVQVTYDIRCDDFKIPALSLQPLVENAIKHGICGREEGGTVRISTRDHGWYFLVEVRDDGVGFDSEEKLGEGHVGLANTRERLRITCNGSLRIESKPGVGTTAQIIIPHNEDLAAGSSRAKRQLEGTRENESTND